MKFDFSSEQTCPSCGGHFHQADLLDSYIQGSVSAGEAPVVTCPHCATLLWRPGLDPESPLFPFVPSTDDEGI